LDLYDVIQNHAAVFLLLMTRVSGLFVMSPFFGSLNIPVYFRAAIAFMMSLVLYPTVDSLATVHAPASVLAYTLAVCCELFIGWLIGFVAYISFSAIQMAGKMMDMQVGFSIVNVMDPTSGQQMPLIGSFLYNLGLIVFLVTNGHHVLIMALFESFQAIPILGASVHLGLVNLISDFTAGIFLTGMKVSMPVTFAILLTNVGLGVLARTMPQMNIFVVGIPMQIVVGIFVLSIMLPFYILFLDVLFNEMYGNISLALQAIQ
jgi:flagellar biosynthesis protein FliR